MNWHLKDSNDGRSVDGFQLVSFLGDLGFVSPIKPKTVSSHGYFLRSCTKVNKYCVYGTEHDLSGTHLSV